MGRCQWKELVSEMTMWKYMHLLPPLRSSLGGEMQVNIAHVIWVWVCPLLSTWLVANGHTHHAIFLTACYTTLTPSSSVTFTLYHCVVQRKWRHAHQFYATSWYITYPSLPLCVVEWKQRSVLQRQATYDWHNKVRILGMGLRMRGEYQIQPTFCHSLRFYGIKSCMKCLWV